jgi:hypothetical protein
MPAGGLATIVQPTRFRAVPARDAPRALRLQSGRLLVFHRNYRL